MANNKKEENFEELKNNLNQKQSIQEELDKNSSSEKKETVEEDPILANVKKLEEENKKIKEDFLRVLAELENTRRRATEENEKTAKYAISKFAEDLIPVMENFYLAFDNIKEQEISDPKKVKSFFDGIKLTQNELKKVFDKNGLERIFPVNEEFDPNFHNAITQIETSEVEEGKVAQVMQAGYKIKDRILRPALVGVAKAK